MNTTLTTLRRLDQHQHEPAPPLRPLGIADRAALHVGLALIRWSRRSVTPRSHRAVSHDDTARARQGLQRARAHQAERAVLLRMR